MKCFIRDHPARARFEAKRKNWLCSIVLHTPDTYIRGCQKGIPTARAGGGGFFRLVCTMRIISWLYYRSYFTVKSIHLEVRREICLFCRGGELTRHQQIGAFPFGSARKMGRSMGLFFLSESSSSKLLMLVLLNWGTICLPFCSLHNIFWRGVRLWHCLYKTPYVSSVSIKAMNHICILVFLAFAHLQ